MSSGGHGPVVIVGAGLAGLSVARELRDGGHPGPILLVGDEQHAPYDRPPLSKGFITGAVDEPGISLVADGEFDSGPIRLVTGRHVEGIDREGRHVRLDDGTAVEYEHLVLCTGVRNRRPPIPGLDRPGVHELRTLSDALALQRDLAAAERVAVLGLGFIGSEVAAALAASGKQVVGIEAFPGPVWVLGEEISAEVQQMHRDHGVQLVLGERAERIDGDERARAVVTSSGEEIPCDVVVFGFGCVPRDRLAREAGLTVDNGIVVDEAGRTSDERIFAAGDVASHLHPIAGRHLRVEHWQHAMKQAAVVAANILGEPRRYDEVHWLWSDHYDHTIQHASVGLESTGRVVRRGERSLVVFGLAGDRVVEVSAIDDPRAVRAAMDLIKSGAPVDAAQLADPAVDLRKLAAASRAAAGTGG